MLTTKEILKLESVLASPAVTKKRVERLRALKMIAKSPVGNRGRHIRQVLSEEIKLFIRQHIESFPTKENHYLGKPICYLDATLNVKTLYRLFKEKYFSIKFGGTKCLKVKKRSYSDEYMKYGFTYMLKETICYPQCVICYKVLGNDSMKPSKLAIHLNKCHPDLRTKMYIHNNKFKEKFLFSSFLETTTKAADIMEIMKQFFNDNKLQWKYLLGITTDGAPAMMGCKSGLQTRIKEIAPNVVGVYCFIHRQALATKTLPGSLKTVFNQLVKLVNHIKSSAFNTRLFTKFCSDLDAEHNKLLFYTSVRWLSAGNLSNEKWTGKNGNVITHSDKLKAFIEKLKLYKTRINNGNLIMFQNLTSVIGNNMLPEVLKIEILCHLDNLINEFGNYFPDVNLLSSEVIISPFSCDVKNVNEEAQEEFIELKNDTTAKDHFKITPLNNFWLKMRNSYPLCSTIALKALIPFSTSCLCEAGFSAMLSIKT
ncbi:protein FAM200C-like [Hydra vulgaris]|uniref:Protein FAM200C-like n=1 Tax=Hydra vulgaris TaxID=6087 RepID=A0ABM4CBB2_HYDVU